MKEYIEREALLERIDGIYDCSDMIFEPNDKCCQIDDCASCKWRETKNAIRRIVETTPAADVQPVVRGKWEWNKNNGFYYCSKCGSISPREDQDGEYCDCPNFCPNCGAEMEES